MCLPRPAGAPFALVFPVYVPMRHGGGDLYGPEPIFYPSAGKCVPVYTDADLARAGMEAQDFSDLAPLGVADEATFRRVVSNFERAGATHLAIDVCTIPGRPGGHLVPIKVAFGHGSAG